jgi:HAMP domain-containing protein
MRRGLYLILGIFSATGLFAQNSPTEQDLRELSALKQKVAASDGVAPANDLAELEALKAKVRQNNFTPEAPSHGTLKVQIIRADEQNTGFELVLILDHAVPAPAVIRASGHAVGEKISYSGIFEGAAKFEGAYYPFLKSTNIEVARPKSNRSEAQGKVATNNTEGEKLDREENSFEHFPPTTIIFISIGVILLTFVVLRIKASWREKRTRSRRH